jgi:DNA-binding transcriptional MocR family regulator
MQNPTGSDTAPAVGHRPLEAARALADRARDQGVILGIGDVFRPNLEPSAWMRFNVALCGDPRLSRFLNQIR